MFKKLLNTLDTLLYLLVAPFGILYVYPHFLLSVEQRLGIELPKSVMLEYMGGVAAVFGGVCWL